MINKPDDQPPVVDYWDREEHQGRRKDQVVYSQTAISAVALIVIAMVVGTVFVWGLIRLVKFASRLF